VSSGVSARRFAYDRAGWGREMTATERMFLRRHFALFRRTGDIGAARRAVIRVGYGIGIRQDHMAKFFGVHVSQVYNAIHGHRQALTALQTARDAIRHHETALAIARGRERAAMERITRYGYQE
jgi:hypothetical protein